MTPEQIAAIRAELGMTLYALAELLGVREQTLWRWEKGKLRIHKPAALLLQRIYEERREKPNV